MPFDSNGVSVVAGQRPVNGQDTDAAQINVPLADIQSMLSQVLLKSGVAPMAGNLNMNGFKISGLSEATQDGDVVTFAQFNAGISFSGVPTGSVQAFRSKTAPNGWVLEDGKTIGNAGSGATGRANADTEALFTHLWSQFTNAELIIQTSGGAASTRGASAAADFAANKRMPLFDSRTRFLRVTDSGLAFDASLIAGAAQADALKAHTHTGTTDSRGSHRHDVEKSTTGGGGNQGFQFGPDQNTFLETEPAGDHTHPFTTNSTGIALETRPRSSVVLYCIKL
jgi:hypothetical protein